MAVVDLRAGVAFLAVAALVAGVDFLAGADVLAVVDLRVGVVAGASVVRVPLVAAAFVAAALAVAISAPLPGATSPISLTKRSRSRMVAAG